MTVKMELFDVVMKLVGPIAPVGSTHVDSERFENLEVLTELTDQILTKLDEVSHSNRDRHEFSRKKVREHIMKFQDRIGIEE